MSYEQTKLFCKGQVTGYAICIGYVQEAELKGDQNLQKNYNQFVDIHSCVPSFLIDTGLHFPYKVIKKAS